jgi:hypothetical protein
MESILGHGLALDLVHSLGPNLGRDHRPPPYNIFLTMLKKTTLKWLNATTPKHESQNSQVMNLAILQVHNFLKCILIEGLCTKKL